jgi:hypothetical protein
MRKSGETGGAQGRNVTDADGDTRLPGLTEGASASPDIPRISTSALSIHYMPSLSIFPASCCGIRNALDTNITGV